ncbi:DUF1467 family protein [Hyphomonas johnsonii]|jgi:predicted secreted protein|uniref:DUF1467 domain-containing protein n=1 Tax=Hyphomonas johnsonii MHS-2 TaxID=1280950 RepID=A0A059FUJ0_9PROT|nr:DUF1467 family protein [Hyphomonas johnsonii]KCZ94365.1 hypothetical protein HJO_03285 [Hyphomonas johnsonii MHS-2]
MTPLGAAVVFVIAWWLCFFAVLPIGVRGQFEDGEHTPGTEEGAPVHPMLAKKAIWATIGGVILTGLIALIVPHLLAN